MSLLLVKQPQVEMEKVTSEDFHLQFVDTQFDEGFEEPDIELFLRKIFKGASPLSYDGYRSIQHNGKTTAQVRFKLSTVGTLSNTSFEEAGRELCRLIFDPKSRKLLQCVTAEGILGVSAVSFVWRSWFNQAYFAAGANQGPPLLQEVVATFTDYLPPWTLVLSFSILVGLNIGVIPGIVIPGVKNDRLQQLFGIGGTRWARQILAAFATHRGLRPQDEIERQWRLDHNKYLACMDIAINSIEQYTVSDDAVAVDSDLSKSDQLIDALCQMANSAATVLTANNQMLKSFLASLDLAKKEGRLARVGVFTSVMVIQAGTTALENAALATAGALAIPGLAVAAGLVGTVYCVYKVTEKAREITKFNASIEFHKEIGVFVTQSWQLAFDIERFLEWVHCTNMTQSLPIDSVSEETRRDWEQFLDNVRRATGDVQVNHELVRAYLELRCKRLVEIREAVDAADKAANPEAYEEANASRRAGDTNAGLSF